MRRMRTGSKVALSFLLLAGCREAEFRCEDGEQCSDGRFCEATGFCSEVDAACPSGRRYLPLSGSLSGECVVETDRETDSPGASPTPAASTGSTTDTPATSLTTEPEEEPGSSTGSGEEESTSEESPAMLEFVDENADDFEAGTLGGAMFDDGLRLSPGEESAWFLSRVFDAGSDTAMWTKLSWAPRAPYSKGLPDGGVSEADYVEGNANMEENVLLLHLDAESDLLAPGTPLPDTSPAMHDVVVQGTASAARAGDPKIGNSVSLNLDAYVRVAPDAAGSLQFGTSEFTWLAWFRTGTPCFQEDGSVNANRVFMGIEDPAGGSTSHTWLGCFNPASSRCGNAIGDGFLGGTVADARGGGLGSFCSQQPVVSSGWRHAALVKRGHANATLEVWLDGALVQSVPEAYEDEISFPQNTPFTLGRLGNEFSSVVDLDEVAIFRRALSAEEVGEVYRRGSLQLSVLTRVCETADCSDVPWSGAGGSESEGWTDVSPEAGQTLELSSTVGRFFQYSVRLTGLPEGGANRTPILDEVRVFAAL